jgi:hypothetical protein
MKKIAILFVAFIFTVLFSITSFAQAATINKKDNSSSLLTRWGVVILVSGKEIRSTLELEQDGEIYKGLVKAAPNATVYSTSLGESPLKNIVITAGNTFTADITFNIIPFGENGKKIEGAMTGKLESEKLSGEINLPGFGKISYWGGKSRKGCANANLIESICMSVGETIADEDGVFRYEYEKDLRNAACVDEFDSDEITNTKIQNMLRELDEKLVCNTSRLAIRNGSLLKLAVASNFGDFIANAINKWKINVNKIDAADNSTVLDFIEDQLEKNGNEPKIVSQLQGYKTRILKAGGRYNKYKELNKQK